MRKKSSRNFTKKTEKSLLDKANGLAEEGSFSEAIEVFSQLIDFCPWIDTKQLSEIYNQRGLMYSALEDNDNAISDLSKAIELKSDDHVFYLNRGNAYSRKIEFDTALEDYNKAIKLFPKYVKAYNSRGMLNFNMGRIDNAPKDLLFAIELDNTYAIPYYNLGLIYYKSEKLDEALEWVKKAYQISPNHASILIFLGDIYADLENPNTAKDYYLKAIKVDSENIRSRLNLAWLLSTCKQDDERNGQKALEYAIWCCDKTDWKDASSLETLAAAHAEYGDFDEAVRW